MLDRCCVPRCKSNYDNGPKVDVFKFPSDEALEQKCIFAIRREEFVQTRQSKVSNCRKSALPLETWLHSENHYCSFCCRFFVRLENGSLRIRFCLRVKKQVVNSGVRRKFSWRGVHSVAYDGHLYLVCAFCDVTIWRHSHISKRTFWRRLLA